VKSLTESQINTHSISTNNNNSEQTSIFNSETKNLIDAVNQSENDQTITFIEKNDIKKKSENKKITKEKMTNKTFPIDTKRWKIQKKKTIETENDLIELNSLLKMKKKYFDSTEFSKKRYDRIQEYNNMKRFTKFDCERWKNLKNKSNNEIFDWVSSDEF